MEIKVSSDLSDRDLMKAIYMEIRDLRARFEGLALEAQAMTSPEKMMELAQQFLGSGFGG